MSAVNRPPDDRDWEKEHAPKVSRRYFAFVTALYCLWIALLGVLAAERWLGSLQ